MGLLPDSLPDGFILEFIVCQGYYQVIALVKKRFQGQKRYPADLTAAAVGLAPEYLIPF